MQLIKPDTNIDFIGKQKIFYVVSLLLILVSIFSLLIHGGPNYGIDFAGGTLIQIKFEKTTSGNDIRSCFDGIGLKDVSVQHYGSVKNNEFLIRTSSSELDGNQLSEKITKAIKAKIGIHTEVRRVEMVGPQVGEDLKKKALLAVFFSLLFITMYISGRFEFQWLLSGITAGALMGAVYILSLFNVSMPFLIITALTVSLILFWFLKLKFALGAIIALIHDVTITIGIFSIMKLDFSLSIIAALLTIIGYSLNDTIIVFDRIRENMKGKYSEKNIAPIFNKSINQTLSRTILTSMTTLIVLFSLYLLGGEIIHDFAFAMIVGIIIGTYSSIFIATPIVFFSHYRKH